MRFFKKFIRLVFFALFWFFVSREILNQNFQDVEICFTQTIQKATPKYITIHHDAIDHPVTLDEINRYHRDSCGWSCGFAYHFYISENKIYQIRNEETKGAHVLNANTANIGICLHGNFDKTKPTLKQQILLIVLVNYLKFKFDIPKQNIKPHQDWEQNNTHCCGQNFDFEKFKTFIFD